MRDYYARLFAEVRRDVLRFWKGQVLVSLSAGIIAAIVSWQLQAIDTRILMISIASAVGAYIIIVGIQGGWSIVITPVKLDQQRVEEIGKWSANAMESNKQLESLRDLLDAKHPRDEHHEKLVMEWLNGLNTVQVEAMQWLLSSGPATTVTIRNAFGYQSHNEIVAAIISAATKGFVHQTPDPRMSGATAYYINENYRTAFTNIFYPPRQPVTPPPA